MTQLGLFEAKAPGASPPAVSAQDGVTSVAVLLERGVLSELDYALAQTLLDIGGERGAALELGIALASWAVQRGHVCADLRRIREAGFYDEAGQALAGIVLPSLEGWLDSLRMSQLVQCDPKEQAVSRPLVLVDARLYLTRYFEYERHLAAALIERSAVSHRDLEGALLEASLDRQFPPEQVAAQEQRRAARLSMLSGLIVISGGPGTGKTFSVAKILLLLQEQARVRGERCEMLLVAPTGKASQRLGEALRENLQEIPEETKRGIPTEASTIHRALGFQQRTPTRFRHNKDNPLPADVVVVDETSMVDLALMTKLVDAVHPKARLILLGDKDQLASVEAGAIFGDICSGLRDGVVHLTRVHRFAGQGPIASLARAVNAGDVTGATAALNDAQEVRFIEVAAGESPDRFLGAFVEQHFARLGSANVSEKLSLLSSFRFLCAHRRGPWGVTAINAWVEKELGLTTVGNAWYAGRPILITENDYALDLFNGDIGVIAEDGDTVAVFPATREGAARRLAPALLPAHETVFAMSVHKSQGSELDEVALLLPEQVSPVITRELIYTAVTRARRKVSIFGSKAVLQHAIETPVQRASGLAAALRG